MTTSISELYQIDFILYLADPDVSLLVVLLDIIWLFFGRAIDFPPSASCRHDFLNYELSDDLVLVSLNPFMNGLAGKRPDHDEKELQETIEENKKSLTQERVTAEQRDLEQATRMGE